MPKKVIIAAAAKTSLYLPIYVAKRRNFFGLLRGYEVDVEPPPERRKDGDNWALRRLSEPGKRGNENVRFAVCDPINAYTNKYHVRVIAMLICKAAFWAVDGSKEIKTAKDFKNFDKLITYPPRMTSFLIGKAIERDCNRDDLIHYVDRGAEFKTLKSLPSSIAMTANIVDAIKWINKNHRFRISYCLAKHSVFSNFMLTGLIARAEESDTKLILGMIRALQMAILLIKFEHIDAVKALRDVFDSTIDEAETVVQKLNNEDLYPISLVPEKAAWTNALKIHSAGSDKGDAMDPDSSFEEFVNPSFAKDIDKKIVQLVLNSTKKEKDMAKGQYQKCQCFLGYPNKSSGIAAKIKGFLRDQCQNCKVFDWKVDFKLGKTIIEELEAVRPKVNCAIILLTKDDLVAVGKKGGKQESQPRPNILLEIGFFVAALGRERVVLLAEAGVKLPSDIHGVIHINFTRQHVEKTYQEISRNLNLLPRVFR